MFISKKILLLTSCMIYSGLVGTYFAGVFPMLINDKLSELGITDIIEINRRTLMVMIVFGIADAIGGYLFGKVLNVFGLKTGMAFVLSIGVLTLILTFIVVYYTEFGFFWYLVGAYQ